jgi:hypothetical protein
LRHQSFAASGWTNQKNIGFLDFDCAFFGFFVVRNPLVVVVHSNAENFLGGVLSDDMLVHVFLDVVRFWNLSQNKRGAFCSGATCSRSTFE